MFYLTTHTTHFVYGCMASDIWIPAAATTWITISDWQQGIFYMHHPPDRITYTLSFVTQVVICRALTGTSNRSMEHHKEVIQRPIAP